MEGDKRKMKKSILAIFVVVVMLATVFGAVSVNSQVAQPVAQPISKHSAYDRVPFVVRLFKDLNKNGYHDPGEPWFDFGAVANLYSPSGGDWEYEYPGKYGECDKNGYTSFAVIPGEEYYLNGYCYSWLCVRWYHDNWVDLIPSEINYYYELGFTFHPFFNSVPSSQSQTSGSSAANQPISTQQSASTATTSTSTPVTTTTATTTIATTSKSSLPTSR